MIATSKFWVHPNESVNTLIEKMTDPLILVQAVLEGLVTISNLMLV